MQPHDSDPTPAPTDQPEGTIQSSRGDEPVARRTRPATPWIVAGLTALTIAAVAVAGTVLLGERSATPAAAGSSPSPVAKLPPPPPSQPPPPPEPEPDGHVSGRCSDLLGEPGPDRYKVLATLNAENTGNIGIIGEVWVEFDLLGGEPLRYVEEVRVPVGETVTVYVDERITREQWYRYLDGGSDCDFGWDLTDTFGRPGR